MAEARILIDYAAEWKTLNGIATESIRDLKNSLARRIAAHQYCKSGAPETKDVYSYLERVTKKNPRELTFFESALKNDKLIIEEWGQLMVIQTLLNGLSPNASLETKLITMLLNTGIAMLTTFSQIEYHSTVRYQCMTNFYLYIKQLTSRIPDKEDNIQSKILVLNLFLACIEHTTEHNACIKLIQAIRNYAKIDLKLNDAEYLAIINHNLSREDAHTIRIKKAEAIMPLLTPLLNLKYEDPLNPSNFYSLDRIKNFLTALEHSDMSALGIHRSTRCEFIIRIIANIISAIPIIGLPRMLHSYAKYGTCQFWQPTGAKLIVKLKRDAQNIVSQSQRRNL